MIQSIIYDGEINEEETTKLLKNLDDLILLKTTNPDLDLKVILYYASNGGKCYCGDYQVDYLNRCLSYFPIEIVTGCSIMSAAVDVLIGFKGKKTVTPLTVGMIHKVSAHIESRNMFDKLSYENTTIRQVGVDNNKLLKKVQSHLTAKEIQRYKNGEEVFLTSSRLNKIINNKPAIKPVPVKSITTKAKSSKTKPTK